MTLILLIGLSLVAVSGVLVLRSFALANADRRRTFDQIAAYGFRSSTPAAREDADAPSALEELATATGEKALARFEGCGQAEKSIRALLNSAGMYQTSVAFFVGTRILAVSIGPALMLLLSLARRARPPVDPRLWPDDRDGLVPALRPRSASGARAAREDRP